MPSQKCPGCPTRLVQNYTRGLCNPCVQWVDYHAKCQIENPQHLQQTVTKYKQAAMRQDMLAVSVRGAVKEKRATSRKCKPKCRRRNTPRRWVMQGEVASNW